MPKFLVCYDVSSEKKRSRLRKKLKDSGLHLQWSVFEVEADNAEQIRKFLSEKIENFESLMVFRIKKLEARLGTDWEIPEYRI
ncbi:MAG: CRISPR-associated endonuclease Cas2 [Aquificae bacterium]|jgi:CRISPR-associated endonuclease Cas2|nr:CRISPR-associated endonuclease Cas2 [Aquificota bacterium]